MLDNYNNTTIYSLNEIKKIVEEVLENHFTFVDRAYLFGSYARNEATKDSDIDIVISLENPNNTEDEFHFYAISPLLERVFKKGVDTLTLNEAKEVMLKTFERDKVLIYEREDL